MSLARGAKHATPAGTSKRSRAAKLAIAKPAIAKPRSSRPRTSRQYVGRVGLAVSHDLFDASTSQIAAQFSQIRNGGVSWVREDLEWGVAEPARRDFNWAPPTGL